MARRRSIIRDLWVSLALQAALAVSAAQTAANAESAYTSHLLSKAADDAFVLGGDAPFSPPGYGNIIPAQDLAPYEPSGGYDSNPIYDMDAALLGGPEPVYDWRGDDFLLLH